MQTTTIRVNEPRELLALIPHQLGFHPQESAVVVSLREPRGRVGLVARVDLADLGDARSGPQLARSLVTHLLNDGAGRAVLVLYTQHEARASDGVVPAAAGHLREAAEPYLRDVASWVVGPHGYFCLGCEDDDCCPPGGRALTELESTAVGAHMVLSGSAVADSRENLVRLAPADRRSRRSAAAARSRSSQRRTAAEASGPGELVRWRERAVADWRSAVGAEPDGALFTDAPCLGRIEAGLTDVQVRDAILVTLVPGTGSLAERSVRGPGRGDEEAISRAVAAIVDRHEGVAPPSSVVARPRKILEAVVAHGRRGAQSPALTLLGLLSWWEGDGARAGVLVERALAHDAGYRLALLLQQALDAGLPPGWARHTP